MTSKLTKICPECQIEMIFDWGEPDTQWDQGSLPAWCCNECGDQEIATKEEIRAMIDYEDVLSSYEEYNYD